MKESLVREVHSFYSLELGREETDHQSVDEIVAYFRARIEADPMARYIAEFDHLAHTKALPDGRIGEAILAAKNIVFCFGITLPVPSALALRPRSIGVAETKQGFLITFMEAPMPLANSAMEDWARGLQSRHAERLSGERPCALA